MLKRIPSKKKKKRQKYTLLAAAEAEMQFNWKSNTWKIKQNTEETSVSIFQCMKNYIPEDILKGH